jgi:hypothetical protein
LAAVIPDKNTTVPERTLIAEVNGIFAPAAGSVPGKCTYSKLGPVSQATNSTVSAAPTATFETERRVKNNFVDIFGLMADFFDIIGGC